jgi:hypothetical protein
MYGWMARHLLGQASGEPITERDVRPLDEEDSRLFCDPARAIIPQAPTVMDLARKKAAEAVAGLPRERSKSGREALIEWARELTAPPESRPHYLAAATAQKSPAPGGVLEKISFNSEDGEYIPGLLWLPERRAAPARPVVIVDDRGKRAVAESGLVGPLLDAGFAVLSVDLRGRGETLGQIRPGWNTNFRLVANQVLFGRPLAGRRAFDLMRAVDYLAARRDVAADRVTVVGLGDDALPALLAAATDTRIRALAVAGYFHSFVSQMKTMSPPATGTLRNSWNDAQLDGRLKTPDYPVDLGSVIPSVLEMADIADIAALVAPRTMLFCQARDNRASGIEALASRFRHVIASAGNGWLDYQPDRELNGRLLLDWLRRIDAP